MCQIFRHPNTTPSGVLKASPHSSEVNEGSDWCRDGSCPLPVVPRSAARTSRVAIPLQKLAEASLPFPRRVSGLVYASGQGGLAVSEDESRGRLYAVPEWVEDL